MKKILSIGMLWNWVYIFLSFLGMLQILFIMASTANPPYLKLYCEPYGEVIELSQELISGALLASISVINGLFWYGLPLYLFLKWKSRKSLLFYSLWVVLGTTVGISFFLAPASLALWRLTSVEYNYGAKESFISFIRTVLELLLFGLFYAGSGLGYVWAYWKHLKNTDSSENT